ncbi:MAG: aldose 1-epimerase family protein [Alloprevotella sp.]|nr:aldose 1-epimerase family protein [Bacteroidales bacterium]MDY3943907.1 aldose 1-epimerase family protein [Alloprevotella sp.]
MITIENTHLRLTIAEEGAEMKSLVELATQREILWQGDEEFWNGTAPILFPNTGRYWQGCFRHQGKQFEQSLHGFVRHRLWTTSRQEADMAVLIYESTADDLSVYPFPFRLQVTYTLKEREVLVDFKVENLGEEEMLFQIGGHPGFNVRTYEDDLDNYGMVRIEGKAKHILRAGEGGCMEADHYEIPVMEDGFIPVTVETFANEALIFEEHDVDFVSLFDSKHRPIVAVKCPSPATLIWVPQGQKAPFVCVEPWWGLPDSIGFNGELSERRYMQSARKGMPWKGGFSFVVF